MSLSWAWPLLDESPEFDRGAAALERPPAAVWVEGLAGTAKWFAAAAMAERLQAPLLIITASEEAAAMAVDDLPGICFPPAHAGLLPSRAAPGRRASRCSGMRSRACARSV